MGECVISVFVFVDSTFFHLCGTVLYYYITVLYYWVRSRYALLLPHARDTTGRLTGSSKTSLGLCVHVVFPHFFILALSLFM